MRVLMRRWLVTLVAVTIAPVVALHAHVTPPRVLMSERDALQRLFPGQNAQLRQLNLAQTLRKQIYMQAGWRPELKYRTFRIGDGSVGTVFVMIDYTAHGPVKTAVGVDAQGLVKGVHVLEVQEEAYVWV